MAKNAIKGITVEIGGNTVGLQKALGDVNKKSGELSAELRQVNNALKFDPTNTTLLAQKQQILSEQIKNTSDKLQSLRSVQQQVEEQYRSGDIGAEAYRAFQRELETTESKLESLENEEKNVGKETQTAEKNTREFGTALSGVKTAADVFVSASGLVVDGLTTISEKAIDAGKEFVSMVDSVGKAGDSIDKSSQAAGMSAESFQEWGYVLQRNGASADSLATWMKKLNNNVDDAASGTATAIEKFERLGISTDDLQSKSREDIFAEVISSLQGMTNESERAAAVNDLLGSSATELGALLNQTAEDTENLRKNAHDLGLVMSDGAVADSAAYADAMLDLQSSLTGVKNTIAADVMPSFTGVLQGLTGMVTGTENADKQITENIKSIVGSISEMAPKAGQTAGVVTSAIAAVAPEIVTMSAELVNSVVSVLAENAPELAATAGDIAVALAEGIAGNTDTILNAVTSVGDTVLEKMPDILGSLISSAGGFARSIVTFLTRSVTIAAQRLPDIISVLTGSLSDTLPLLSASVLDLVTQTVNAVLELLPEILPDVLLMVGDLITAFLPQLVNTVVALTQGIVDDLPVIVEVLAAAIPQLISSLLVAVLAQVPTLLSGAIQLADSIVAALPQIINAIIPIVPQIINAVVTQVAVFLPRIVSAGLQLFTSLINDLPKIITAITKCIPDIISAIIDAVMYSLPLLIDCGVELFVALVENLPEIIKGITDAIPRIVVAVTDVIESLHGKLVESGSKALLKLIEDVPVVIDAVKSKAREIVQAISDAIYSKYGDLIDAGYNLITGMWQGIANAKDWIIDKIGGFTDSVVDAFTDFFDIHSPSGRIEREVGEYTGEAVGTGTVKAMPKVRRMIRSAVDDLVDNDVFLPSAADPRMTVSAPAQLSAAAQDLSASARPLVINFEMHIDAFYNSTQSSMSELTEQAMQTLYKLVRENKLAY